MRRAMFFLLMGLGTAAGAAAEILPVVPAPREVEVLAAGFAPGPEEAVTWHVAAGETRADLAGPLAQALQAWRGTGLVRADGAKARVVLGLPARDEAFHRHCERLDLLPDAALGSEGYVLQIDKQGITAAANEETGLFYALQTLRQILRAIPTGAPLPAVRVRDWPEFAFRGVMDDISRGPLPNPEFLRQQVRRLAELKINRLTWYIEDVVRVPSHPDLSPEGAIELDELRDLAEYAWAHHIEAVGSFQSLGHFEKILKRPQYRDLGVTYRMLDPGAAGPLNLLRDVMGDMLPAFPTGIFALNGDEAFDLNQIAAERGTTAAKLYADHFLPLLDWVEQHGRQGLIWGDMMLEHRELLDLLPNRLMVGTWNYDAEADFAGLIAPFRERGFPVVVCPGVVNSHRLSPDYRATLGNISGFTAAARALGAEGVLTTVWDDGGMHLFSRDWLGVAYAAEKSWNTDAGEREDFFGRYGVWRGDDDTGALGLFLHEWNELRGLKPTWLMSNRYRHIRVVPRAGETLQVNLAGWTEVSEIVDRARVALDQVRVDGDKAFWAWTVEEVALHADLRFALARWAESGPNLAKLDALIARQRAVHDELRRLWFVENRDFYTEEALRPDTARLKALEEMRARWVADGAKAAAGVKPVNGQFFEFWLVAGPIAVAETAGLSEVPDLLGGAGGEAGVAPKPGAGFEAASGGWQQWVKHETDLDTCLDLQGQRAVRGVVYAYANIDSTTERAVSAAVEHTGELEVLINGEKIVAPANGARCVWRLRAGRNTVLLKALPPAADERWKIAVNLPDLDVRHRKHRYVIRESDDVGTGRMDEEL